MLIGGLVEVFLGIQAAGQSLEQVTKPLTAVPAAEASQVPDKRLAAIITTDGKEVTETDGHGVPDRIG
jgi:hypothetical protein